MTLSHFIHRATIAIRTNPSDGHREWHARQFELAVAGDHRLDGSCWDDIVARLKVGGRNRQAVESDEFAPRVGLGETTAHRIYSPGRDSIGGSHSNKAVKAFS